MRTTLAIADDILREFKKLARGAGGPMTDVANEVLRAGLAVVREPPKRARIFKEAPTDMGEPRIDSTKALALSHGATLASCDNVFARFPDLRWQNPAA